MKISSVQPSINGATKHRRYLGSPTRFGFTINKTHPWSKTSIPFEQMELLARQYGGVGEAGPERHNHYLNRLINQLIHPFLATDRLKVVRKKDDTTICALLNNLSLTMTKEEIWPGGPMAYRLTYASMDGAIGIYYCASSAFGVLVESEHGDVRLDTAQSIQDLPLTRRESSEPYQPLEVPASLKTHVLSKMETLWHALETASQPG